MNEQISQSAIIKRLQDRAAEARKEGDPYTATACEGIAQAIIVSNAKQQRGLPIERVARELQKALADLNATEAQIALLTRIHYVDVE